MLYISKAFLAFLTDHWKQLQVSPKNEDEGWLGR